ncbi:MAG TPA: response regulator transcription factor [Phnomibacter sp.]|nr:response regulator transcription factor [Phnomibacter sp.]
MAHKRTILLVEDEFVIYDDLSQFFEEKGFKMIEKQPGLPIDNYNDAISILKHYEPDVAVLDIQINGDKDGIEIGNYIRCHYNIPVIYLSAYDNYENIARIRQTGADGFVVKSGKPIDKQQLWASLQLVLPRRERALKKKTLGSFFKVRQLSLSAANHHTHKQPKDNEDPLEIETYIKWNDLLYIESYNSKLARSGNNNLLLHTKDSQKAYMLRGTITEMEQRLPEQFVRFDQSTIVNVSEITSRNKSRTVYFIGELRFKLSETYKNTAVEKLAAILGAL